MCMIVSDWKPEIGICCYFMGLWRWWDEIGCFFLETVVYLVLFHMFMQVGDNLLVSGWTLSVKIVLDFVVVSMHTCSLCQRT